VGDGTGVGEDPESVGRLVLAGVVDTDGVAAAIPVSTQAETRANANHKKGCLVAFRRRAGQRPETHPAAVARLAGVPDALPVSLTPLTPLTDDSADFRPAPQTYHCEAGGR
jgi:hypothetical protein